MKQMQKAKRRIDFAIFTFSQSSGIDDTMITLTGAGRKIRGALDGQAANQRWQRPVPSATPARSFIWYARKASLINSTTS